MSGENSLLTFAVSKAELAAYNSGAAVSTWTEIPVVAESSVEYTKQASEVADAEGSLIHIWRHSTRAKVTLRMKRFAFKILEVMSGSPVSSYGVAFGINFGTATEVNPPYMRLRLQQQAVDENGNTGYFVTYIYKAQGTMPSISMREVTAGDYQITFDALLSTRDEAGNVIPSSYFRAVGMNAAKL